MRLREEIEALFASEKKGFTDRDLSLFADFKAALNSGRVRAAERGDGGAWRVNQWVKRGILLGFRMGALVDMSVGQALHFFDKSTYPVRPMTVANNVRIVPGGSSIRDGAYIAP
ncbi:MAG TPA: hypothetical protein VEQ40_12095, partial [Pyrinomonadaceae bacterium]|nr:hypothetical protein [Pyrinomonadaceae bacterium]